MVIAQALSCAPAAKWRIVVHPGEEEAIATMTADGMSVTRISPRADELPMIPMRRKLRPCCAFGHELKISLGVVPIPGYEIGNVQGLDDLGRHEFDSGALASGGSLDGGPLTRSEGNGQLYSCRGGFIDTAHVRDNVDWTLLLGVRLTQLFETGGSFDLPDEGGTRRIILKPLPAEILDRHEMTPIALVLARWIAFEISIWHEIATWFDWSSIKSFPEKVSSFSPEDLYSNMLGTKVALGVIRARYAGDEFTYNHGVDQWIELLMQALQVVPKQVAIDAIEAVDGHWWDSNRRLPNAHLTLRRNLDVTDPLLPWLIPDPLAPDSLKEFCGEDPQPLPLPNTEVIDEFLIADFLSFEVEPDPRVLASPGFAQFGAVITNRDFPAIIEEIRAQNELEFGPRADQPD